MNHGFPALGRQRAGQGVGIRGGRASIFYPHYGRIHHRSTDPSFLHTGFRLVFGYSGDRIRQTGGQT